MRYGSGTIGARLQSVTERSKTLGAADPARDALLIVAHVLDKDPSRLRMMLDEPISDDYLGFGAGSYYTEVLKSYEDGKPISKIIGKRAFWKDDFYVNEDVLDPRPDTERLIEIAIEAPFSRVLDLGTGSGCILISLLSEQRDALGVGVDVSDAALDVARRNSTTLGAENAEWTLSDWYKNVEGDFDLIVSNPPYIAANEMAGLASNVRNFDPEISLTDGADGLTCYRIICAGIPKHLRDQGRLIVEIGPTQADEVRTMFVQAGLANVQVFQDLDGRDRIVSGFKG
jgi:release factor glutamine methyltransferase